MTENLLRGREEARALDIDFMERDEVHVGDVRFLGTTLWTDFDLMGDAHIAMRAARTGINDHRTIRLVTPDGSVLFTPEMAREQHLASRDWLDARLGAAHTGPTVVITHHCPSRLSVHPKYLSPPSSLNAAFASNLDWLIEKHQPELWVHGHTPQLVRLPDRGHARTLQSQGLWPYGWGPPAENDEFKPVLLVRI